VTESGCNGAGVLNTVDIWNSETFTWNSLPFSGVNFNYRLSLARIVPASTSVGSYALFAGGGSTPGVVNVDIWEGNCGLSWVSGKVCCGNINIGTNGSYRCVSDGGCINSFCNF
jgi:hypothetical protein